MYQKGPASRAQRLGSPSPHFSPGFTLAELIIVIVIIGILAAITIVAYNGTQQRARTATLMTDLKNASNQLALDTLQNGTYPASTAAANGGQGLKASPGTTWQYTYTSAGNTYCLTATNSNVSYFSTSAIPIPQLGACPGHINGGGTTYTLAISAGANGTVNTAVNGTYNSGSTPTITATPSGGYIFSNWSGSTGCSGITTASYAITMDGNKTCTANFTVVVAACPTGFIPVPGSATYGTSNFCVMKYEAKNVGGVATSQAAGLSWVSISQTLAISVSSAACSGCHLITESEYLTLIQNVTGVASNWTGGAVGSGAIYSGNNDSWPTFGNSADVDDNNGYYGTGDVSPSNQRRTLTLSNGEVIWDLAGNVWEWTSGQTASGQPGISGEVGYHWKEWNAATATGSLTPNPFPSYGRAAASGWTSAQGIGKLYSNNSTSGTLVGFLRGGGTGDLDIAGVSALNLSNVPSNVGTSWGFRVSK